MTLKTAWQHTQKAWHRLEDGLLMGVFMSMLILAVAQIVARNLFDFSWSWIDPLNRIGVLWIALLGSLIGARQNNHIKIDVALHVLPSRLADGVMRLISALSCGALVVLAWHTGRMVLDERLFGSPAFAGFLAWPFQTIMPVAFGLMALRYAVMVVFPVRPESETTEAESTENQEAEHTPL